MSWDTAIKNAKDNPQITWPEENKQPKTPARKDLEAEMRQQFARRYMRSAPRHTYRSKTKP